MKCNSIRKLKKLRAKIIFGSGVARDFATPIIPLTPTAAFVRQTFQAIVCASGKIVKVI